jgi:hypothetical protein
MEHHACQGRAQGQQESLDIYDKGTRQKRYSVTTSAGIKIQPYFDVPPPSDKNLYYFRVQSEPVNATTVRLWVSAATAHALKTKLGSLDSATVSTAILKAIKRVGEIAQPPAEDDGLAVAVDISKEAHMQLLAAWKAVSDEHRGQLLLKALA